jgi:chorismate-pyruvate lyase
MNLAHVGMVSATISSRSKSLGVEWRGSWSPRCPVEAASLARLPVLQRLLLTTDGTVTTALATLAGEPIGVRMLDQRTAVLAHDDGELALLAGESVIERRALLHGAQSGTPLLYGASRIVPQRLPRGVRDALVDGGVAIGVVLRAHELETFRVPLRVGVLAASDGAVPHLGSGLMCRRRYAINAGGKALMVIDEQFPFAGFGAR